MGALSFIAISPIVTNELVYVDTIIPTKKCISHFDYAYNSFKYYNKRTDTSTVNLFISVTKKFNLYSDTSLFRTCVAQICVESGAKQFYGDGTLIVSSGNAIGFGQVVPTTGFLFLKKIVSKNIGVMKSLGGAEFSNIIKHNRCNRKARKKVKAWLGNKKNNIILWGYIMDYCINKGDNLSESMIIYNQGEGYLRKFLRKKGVADQFAYNKHIAIVRNKLDKLFNKNY